MKKSLLTETHILITKPTIGYRSLPLNKCIKPTPVISKLFKQSELIDEGYKVLLYLENDFVRALGFLTQFNTYIPRGNINELVIDSTFKTNQEKFELFAV